VAGKVFSLYQCACVCTR